MLESILPRPRQRGYVDHHRGTLFSRRKIVIPLRGAFAGSAVLLRSSRVWGKRRGQPPGTGRPTAGPERSPAGSPRPPQPPNRRIPRRRLQMRPKHRARELEQEGRRGTAIGLEDVRAPPASRLNDMSRQTGQMQSGCAANPKGVRCQVKRRGSLTTDERKRLCKEASRKGAARTPHEQEVRWAHRETSTATNL